MKNTKKILLGYLLTMMFVLGATLAGCGSDCSDGQAKDADDNCTACTNGDTRADCNNN